MRELMKMPDVFEEMRRMQESMNHLMTRMHPLAVEKKAMREPVTCIRETETQIVADIELPGIDKENIQLHVTPHNLEIKAVQKHELKKGSQYAMSERSFYRSFTLPAEVDPNSADAAYKNGILHLKIDKAQLKHTKRIQIK